MVAESEPMSREDDESVYKRGRARFDDGNIQGALEDYRRACAVKCTWKRSANRGNAAYQLGLFAEAVSSIQLALKGSPEGVRPKLKARLEEAKEKCREVNNPVQIFSGCEAPPGPPASARIRVFD